jgi:hypothetical protein
MDALELGAVGRELSGDLRRQRLGSMQMYEVRSGERALSRIGEVPMIAQVVKDSLATALAAHRAPRRDRPRPLDVPGANFDAS